MASQPDVRQRHICPSDELRVDYLLQRITLAEPLQQGGHPMWLPIVWEVHMVDVPEGLPATFKKKGSTPSTIKHAREDLPSRLVRPELASLERIASRLPGDPLLNPSLLSLPIRVHICIQKLQVITGKFQ